MFILLLTCENANTRQVEALETSCLFRDRRAARPKRWYEHQYQYCNYYAYDRDEIEHPWPRGKCDQQCSNDKAYDYNSPGLLQRVQLYVRNLTVSDGS